MIEKRFAFVCDDDNCFFKDKDKSLYCYEVVELLNELAEENEQLKRKMENVYNSLVDENEQLTETFQILYEQYKDALKIIKNLKKENEQLKTTISNYMDCIDKLYIENERLKRKLEFEEYKKNP